MDHNYENDVPQPKIELITEEELPDEDDLTEITEEEQVEQDSPEKDQNTEKETEEGDATENAVKNNPGGLSGPNNFYSRLINLVKAYPNIYDKFDPGFKSAVAREKSWEAIAKTLNTSVSFAQNRWIRLRERFAREKKALDAMQKSGNLNDKKRLWPYFLPMLFLSSHIKTRRTGASVGGSSSQDSDCAGTQDMSVSAFLSDMSSSTLHEKKTVEVMDESHPEYIAWKKRKPSDAPSQPRKIMAKPDGSLTTVMLATKSQDGENKFLTKLPPGAVLLKNPPGSLGTSPVVLVPTTQAIGKPNSLPTVLLQPTPHEVSATKPNTMAPVPDSAEHHFGMLIAKELERFPKEIRAKKKQKILMCLYD